MGQKIIGQKSREGIFSLCSGEIPLEFCVQLWNQAGRGEGSRESSEPLPGPKGTLGELERDTNVAVNELKFYRITGDLENAFYSYLG